MTAPDQLELFVRETAAPLSAEPPASVLVAPASREERLLKADALARTLAGQLKAQVRLSITDNRSTMVSFRRRAGLLSMRLHHMFLDAPENVVTALAEYAGRNNVSSGEVIDRYVQSQRAAIRQRGRVAKPGQSRGRCFDLQELFDTVNAAHFDGQVAAVISWGKRPGKRRRKSIRLGVYDHTTREIRIHPALDRPEVPRFFVEYIVFHEMLHQRFPGGQGVRGHVHHPQAFRERERAYPHYAAALKWEKQHLKSLLAR